MPVSRVASQVPVVVAGISPSSVQRPRHTEFAGRTQFTGTASHVESGLYR